MKKKPSKLKSTKDRVIKYCILCSSKIKVILYTDRSYVGGYYFGKIPMSTKKEWARVMKLGTRKSKIGSLDIQVLKEDPKPYKYFEYWECLKCCTDAI